MQRPSRILLATRNPGKVREIRALLADIGIVFVSPEDICLPSAFDVEETGKTFHENAELKARGFAEKAKMMALADDSGLAVKSLNGAPGIYSKRYAPGSEADRTAYLLHKMEGIEDRSAAFISVICVYDPKTKTSQFFEGRIDGTLEKEAKGESGFGYDPVFVPTGYQKTFGEMSFAEKNQISHRYNALMAFKKFIEEQHD